jgi:molybdopterin-guanine dinucleotide biosynthesis protein A
MPPADPSEADEPDISGVVLAGGASRRMGVDKATLRTDAGLTFVEHAASVLGAAGARPVAIATGTAGRLGPLPWPEVDDGPHRGAGPLAGVLAALRWSPAPVVAVLAVDLPGASAPLLRWLASQWRHDDRALVPLDPTGRAQPLHALFATATADLLEHRLAAGDRRVLGFAEAAGARLLTPPADVDGVWWTNRNRPGDRE